jgi:hypothetical protein
MRLILNQPHFWYLKSNVLRFAAQTTNQTKAIANRLNVAGADNSLTLMLIAMLSN